MKNISLMDSVLEFCKKYIAKDLNATIHPETKLIESFPLDSLNSIEILVLLETEFSITIDDDDLNIGLLETPDKICTYITSKL